MKFTRSGPITINNLVYTAARGILTLVHHCEQHRVVSVVPDSGKVAEQDRRDPRQLVSHIQSSETSCRYVESVDAIVAIGSPAEAKRGATVAVLSNGGFGWHSPEAAL